MEEAHLWTTLDQQQGRRMGLERPGLSQVGPPQEQGHEEQQRFLFELLLQPGRVAAFSRHPQEKLPHKEILNNHNIHALCMHEYMHPCETP